MRKISRRQGLGSEEPGSPFGSPSRTIWSPAHTFWAPVTVLTLWSGLVHPQLVIMHRSHGLLASPWFALMASIASFPSCTTFPPCVPADRSNTFCKMLQLRIGGAPRAPFKEASQDGAFRKLSNKHCVSSHFKGHTGKFRVFDAFLLGRAGHWGLSLCRFFFH